MPAAFWAWPFVRRLEELRPYQARVVPNDLNVTVGFAANA